MPKKITALILLISLGLIWGTGYSIARFAMTHDVPAFGYSFWQSLGPACFLLCISMLIKNKSQEISINKKNNHFSNSQSLHCKLENSNIKTWTASSRQLSFPLNEKISAGPQLNYLSDSVNPEKIKKYFYYFICGLTGIAIPNSIMYIAAKHLPAGILAVIVNTVPIITYPLALFAGTEKFNLLRLVAIISAIIGLMLIILPGNQLPTINNIPWILIVLLTPLSFAFCAVYIARFRPTHSNALTLATGTLISSSLLLLPIVLITKSFYLPHFPFTLPDWVILLEIILSSMGYILFFQLIKIAGPVYYSLVDTTVSLTGLTWGYFLFHEKLTSSISFGILFILIALFLVTRKQKSIK